MGRLPFDLDIEDIAALADIVNEKKLGEIFLKDDDIGAKIVIKARPCPPPPPHGHHHPPMGQDCPPPPMMPPSEGISIPDTVPAQQSAEGSEIKSPIVGTFYSSPSPDKPPFVQVGQRVSKGDVIMIVESMKIMNEIPSPVDGVVKKILVNSGDAVEYDQTVMIIG